MIAVTYKVKDYFFDRLAVQKKIGEDRARFLRNAGGYVQKTAQRSMRRVGKKGKPSKPGQPPKFHGNESFSLRSILYALDPSNGSVIVGPVRGNAYHYFGARLVRGTVPQTHEEGGQLGILEKFKPFTWAAAINAFGQARAQQYVQLFGLMNAQRWGAIYKDEFSYRADRARDGIWVPAGRRRKDRFLTRVRESRYPARPFMRPAMVKTMQRPAFVGKLWFGNAPGLGGAAA